jgi:hypothetical protein
MKKPVIIESPYAGDTPEQVDTHERYARAALFDSLTRGEAPIASHLLHTQVLDDKNKEHRETGIEAGLAWYRMIDPTALGGDVRPTCVVYVDCGQSSGMLRAMERARSLGCKIELRRVPGWGS